MKQRHLEGKKAEKLEVVRVQQMNPSRSIGFLKICESSFMGLEIEQEGNLKSLFELGY